MTPMQPASGAITPYRQPGAQIPNPAGQGPSVLGATDDRVRAHIAAAVAGVAMPLSLTSAPCAASYQAVAAKESKTPRHREPSAPPPYPPLGRYGNRLERVEAVGRFAHPHGAWSHIDPSAFDGDDERALPFESSANAAASPAEPSHDFAALAARDDGDIYSQLTWWLRTHKQSAALRELAQLRRVLVLAPADKSGMSWQGHLMCPAPAARGHGMAVHVPGAEGRSWPLRTQGAWMLTEPAGRWQRWRMRQHLGADGVWQLNQHADGPHAPAWCIDGAPQLLPAPVCDDIPLQLTEPQRLRRLLGTQWTVLVLRAPEPLPWVSKK